VNVKLKQILFPLFGKNFPFFTTGADVNRNTLCFSLASKGYPIVCIGTYQKRENLLLELKQKNIAFEIIDDTLIKYDHHFITCLTTSKENFFNLIQEKIQACDIVFSINRESTKIISIAKENGATTVALITDAISERKKMYEINPDYILYNSESLANFGKQFHSSSYHIFPPTFTPVKNEGIPKKLKNNITLVNPIFDKGSDVFLALSKTLPSHHFLAVEGWKPIQIEPEYLDQNVRYFNKKHSRNMHLIYQETGILISPSRYNEGFGRTIIEAGLHGTPSIVSNKGALPETIGEGGIVVNDYETSTWLNAIKKIEMNYEYYSRKAFENAQQYLLDPEEELKKIGIL